MIKTFLICALAISITTQACTKGCLKCTTDDKCLLCDISKGYKLENDICSIADQPNCTLITVDGNCFVCAQNYYFSSITSKCVAVETLNVITNCAHYNSSQVCISCDSNFYVNNGKCTAPTTLISNCDDYQTALLCESCKDGYFLSLDNKSCATIPSTSNCFAFSRFKCEDCKTGYINNRNLYFNSAFNLTSTAEKTKVLVEIIQNSIGDKEIQNNPVCQTQTVTNCFLAEDFKTCKECNSGYFLKEGGTCQINLTDKILNCLKYSAEKVCSECNQGFFLKNSTTCEAITTIDNCSTYNSSANTNKCSQCNSDYYLNTGSNSCIKRVNSLGSLISNCKTKDLLADKCSVCNTNYHLSSDGIKCFDNISNCKTHNNTSSSATENTCATCNDLYYKSGQVCTLGTIDKCVVYEQTQNICTTCTEGYYHPGNSCVQHINIPNCTLYSQVDKNTCDTCGNFTYNFNIESFCENRPEISNCAVYNHGDTTSTCTTCAQGYKKIDDTTCEAISTSNCAELTGNNCSKCNAGFALFESTTNATTTYECKIPHDFLNDQCELLVTDNAGATLKVSEATCTDCKIHAFTIDYENGFACINNDYLKVKDIEVNTQIDNCLKYATNTTCALCGSGYYLKADQTLCLSNGCGTNGAAQNYSAMVLANDGAGPDKYWVEKYNFCETVNDNDFVKAPDLDDLSNTIVIKCLSGKPEVVTATGDAYTNVNPNGSFGNWIQSPAAVYPEVTCPANVTDINGDTTSTLIDRCSYYISLGGTAIGCFRCDHGFSGKAAAGYITSCTSNAACSSSFVYNNLNVFWTKFISCHKCTDSNKIPYVAYTPAAAGNVTYTAYAPFQVVNKDWLTVANDDSLVNLCINNTSVSSIRSDLSIPVAVLDDKIEFVANCGVGFLNLTADADSFDSTAVDAGTLAASHIQCAACKPGYKPTFRAGNLTVSACALIDNCPNSTWFNACSACSSGYAFKYDGGIDYTECVQYSKDSNCYAYVPTANSEECKVCKKGYFLNRDNYCEKVKAPRCSDSNWTPFVKFLDDADAKFYLYANEQGPGCNECESGYTAFKYAAGKYAQYACALSPHISTNINAFPKQPDDDPTKFINYCEVYSNLATNVSGGTAICKKCNSNYVLRDNGTECLSLNTVSNCVKATNTGTNCLECQEGYGLLTSGNCSLGNIANCKTYNVDNSAAVVTCDVCNPLFYKKDNTCLEAGVANCDVLGSQYICNTCADGYILVNQSQIEGSGSASHNYCYPNDPNLNCKNATITSHTRGANYKCDTGGCTNLYGKVVSRSDTQAKTDCLAFNKISECDTHDQGSTLLASTLYCTQCKTGFYYDNLGSRCVKRLVLPTSCKTYQLGSDLCAECNDGNYRTTDNKNCLPYPTGIIGCRVYTDINTCTACDQNRYLSGNLCVEVGTPKIDNCLYYSNATTCSACDSNYFLSNNLCTQYKFSNCLVAASASACQTCLNGFILKTDNGITTCQAHTKANCAIFEQTGTFRCTQCNQFFYIDANGDCLAASTPAITNCLIQDTKDTCKKCGDTTALSADKKSCIDRTSWDINCNEAVMPSDLFCSFCSPGYYFKNEVCTAFDKNSISSGCFTTLPTDTTNCLICNTGYYMNKSQSCIKIDTTPVPEPESTTIAKSLIVVILTLFFMFQIIL